MTRVQRGHGWMDTLRQAAAIRSAPEAWAPRHAADHDACAIANPRVPSLNSAGAHRTPSHKRMREMMEQEGGYGGYSPSTSPSGAALPSLLVSRGSFQSLEDAGSPQPSQKVARRLLVASPSSSCQSPTNQVVLRQLLLEKQRQLQDQRLQQEQLQKQAEEGDSPPWHRTLTLLTELLTSHLVQSFSPASIARQLEAILAASCLSEHRTEAELLQLRQVQNLIWDIVCMDGDSSVPPTFPRATKVAPEASSCSSSNRGTKQSKTSPHLKAESKCSGFTHVMYSY